MSKIYYKLEIMNTGGEYAYGFITDENEKNLLRERAESDEIALCNSFDDGTEINFYDKTEVMHCYGPNSEDSTVTLTSYRDESLKEEIETIFSYEDIREIGLNQCTIDTPKGESDEDSGELEFGGFYTEKRVVYPAVIELDEGEEFEASNVYVGTILMDEIFFEEVYIVDKVFYIRPEIAKEIVRLYQKNDFNEDNYYEEMLSEEMWDIFYSIQHEPKTIDSKIRELLSKAEAGVLDIEGKGESEDHYAIVREYGELIFDSECGYTN